MNYYIYIINSNRYTNFKKLIVLSNINFEYFIHIPKQYNLLVLKVY